MEKGTPSMSFIQIKNGSQTDVRSFTGAVPLKQLLHGYTVDMPCNGNHTCGKCLVRISGACSEPTEQERVLLGERQKEGYRLLCFTTALGDCEVELPNADHLFVEQGFRENDFPFSTRDGYGIAADIGTTTIVAYLYSRSRKQPLASCGEMNRQRSFGADVISRIEYGMHHSWEELQESVTSQLSMLFQRLMQNARIPADQIRDIVITGNTTMLHFLLGLDASGIAAAPFTPKSLFGYSKSAYAYFPDFPAHTTLYLPDCIGSYVGADVVCSILASGMCHREGVSLLADIGTNGEMALYVQGKLLTCSTAAGPAFEGAEIAMGMTAAPGAICEIAGTGGSFLVKTIDNVAARGICGTGLISALALFLELGLVDESGRIQEDGHPFAAFLREYQGEPAIELGSSGILLTQGDIRKLQLAKAAICAGIRTLSHEAGISLQEMDAFYLCGGFGSYIDPQKAARIGLFPAVLAEKTIPLGNGAGRGAGMLLLSPELREESRQLAQTAQEIPLSANPYFMDQ